MLLNNLNKKFKEFIYYLLVYMKNKTFKFNKIVALLYKEKRFLKKNIKE